MSQSCQHGQIRPKKISSGKRYAPIFAGTLLIAVLSAGAVSAAENSSGKDNEADNLPLPPTTAVKLSPAEQKIMNDAANETRGYQRQVSRAAAQKAVGELQAKGMQYNEVAPAEQARMRQIAKAVTDKFIASYDPAVAKLYTDELARIHKG